MLNYTGDCYCLLDVKSKTSRLVFDKKGKSKLRIIPLLSCSFHMLVFWVEYLPISWNLNGNSFETASYTPCHANFIVENGHAHSFHGARLVLVIVWF